MTTMSSRTHVRDLMSYALLVGDSSRLSLSKRYTFWHEILHFSNVPFRMTRLSFRTETYGRAGGISRPLSEEILRCFTLRMTYVWARDSSLRLRRIQNDITPQGLYTLRRILRRSAHQNEISLNEENLSEQKKCCTYDWRSAFLLRRNFRNGMKDRDANLSIYIWSFQPKKISHR